MSVFDCFDRGHAAKSLECVGDIINMYCWALYANICFVFLLCKVKMKKSLYFIRDDPKICSYLFQTLTLIVLLITLIDLMIGLLISRLDRQNEIQPQFTNDQVSVSSIDPSLSKVPLRQDDLKVGMKVIFVLHGIIVLHAPHFVF